MFSANSQRETVCLGQNLVCISLSLCCCVCVQYTVYRIPIIHSAGIMTAISWCGDMKHSQFFARSSNWAVARVKSMVMSHDAALVAPCCRCSLDGRRHNGKNRRTTSIEPPAITIRQACQPVLCMSQPKGKPEAAAPVYADHPNKP